MMSLMTIPTRTVSYPGYPFARIADDFDRMFDEFFGTRGGGNIVRFGREWPSWENAPRCDVTEREAEYTLRAELPGFSKDDIHVDVQESAVSLRGEHKEEEKSEGECYVCRESTLGSFASFERTIGLPGEIKVDDVKASLKDGVLTLHLPKAQVQTRRQIEVEAA
jgi:HSP20 family protein